MRKYVLTDIVLPGTKLRRIRRLSTGELGGYISGEHNLPQAGNAWVSGDARVYGNAQVSGNAQVYGDARVYGYARVYGDAQVYGYARVYGDAQVSGDARVYGNAQVYGVVKMVTRSDGYTFTVFPCADAIWRLTAGCRFFTLEEAWQHWQKTRAGTPLGEETFDILVMFEHHIERNGGHK